MMIFLFAALSLFEFFAPFELGAHAVHAAEAPQGLREVSLRAKYSVSQDALTTEKVWVLDPEEMNPHRQRWLLNRKLELLDLKPRELPGAKNPTLYGVSVGGLDAVTTAYFRENGPWYRPLTDFPCSPDPLSWFGTLAGSHVAADTAAKDWENLLEEERIKLSVLLNRVSGVSPGMAIQNAKLIYDEWLKNVELNWRAKGRVNAKLAEWKSYWAEAKSHGACKNLASAKKTAKAKAAEAALSGDEYVPSAKPPIPWEVMMEPPAVGEHGRAGIPIDETKLLARAPAKLWHGLLSIRLNLTVAGRKLNGNFLVNSGSGTSVVSPDFLTNQGVLAAWIASPSIPFRRVPWGGGGRHGSHGGLAPVVTFDQVEIGNTPIQLKDFALFDTEFFAPPEQPKTCCDGVLGTDFLRRYVVEFHPGVPAEVKLWPAEGFHLSFAASELDGVPDPEPSPRMSGDLGLLATAPKPIERSAAKWIEVALGPNGDPISPCLAKLNAPGAKNPVRLVGVRWDTGREDSLEVHAPWQKLARSGGGAERGWELHCGPSLSEVIARNVPATFPQSDTAMDSPALQAKVPAATVGMKVLGRGRLFFDFPHGRIWFPDAAVDEPIRRDRSGLVLKFEMQKQKKNEVRVLVVKSIRRGSLAQSLIDRGLKPGMIISQIDKTDVDGMDGRDISRRLSGEFGEQVYVQWRTTDGFRLGLIKGIRQ